MRRTSLVAPLLLIGIGGMLLARNVFPELPLLDWLAKYWPLLLIIWGAARLLEIVVWAIGSKPVPRVGISGGEWALIVFLCFLGAGLHAVRGFSPWAIPWAGIDMFGQTFEYPVSLEKPSSKKPHLVFESFRGNARISGADVDSIKVAGHNTIRSLDQQSADRANQDSPVELVGGGDQLRIRANQSRISDSRRIEADLEITVPRGASIEAHGRNGDFDISGIEGSVNVDSDRASLRLENIGGDATTPVRGGDIIRAVNVKGSIEMRGRGNDIDIQGVSGPVTVNGNYPGIVQFRELAKTLHWVGPQTSFTIEAVPGQLRHTRADVTGSNLVGPIRFESTSKDVRFSEFTNGLDLSINNRGDVELRPALPLAKINAHTRAGNIELALPASAKFDLEASSDNGAVTDDFGPPLTLIEGARPRRGAVLRGSNGGPQVHISTDRGQVTVRRAAASESSTIKRLPAEKEPAPLRATKPIEQ